MNKRWPKAEPIIAQDPWSAYRYARDVIEGRWPEAEPYIAQDPVMAFYYARDIIKGRWPEAEPYIVQDDTAAHCYKHTFKLQWPNNHQALADLTTT